jgi:hypothetical protein
VPETWATRPFDFLCNCVINHLRRSFRIPLFAKCAKDGAPTLLMTAGEIKGRATRQPQPHSSQSAIPCSLRMRSPYS